MDKKLKEALEALHCIRSREIDRQKRCTKRHLDCHEKDELDLAISTLEEALEKVGV